MSSFEMEKGFVEQKEICSSRIVCHADHTWRSRWEKGGSFMRSVDQWLKWERLAESSPRTSHIELQVFASGPPNKVTYSIRRSSQSIILSSAASMMSQRFLLSDHIRTYILLSYTSISNTISVGKPKVLIPTPRRSKNHPNQIWTKAASLLQVTYIYEHPIQSEDCQEFACERKWTNVVKSHPNITNQWANLLTHSNITLEINVSCCNTLSVISSYVGYPSRIDYKFPM